MATIESAAAFLSDRPTLPALLVDELHLLIGPVVVGNGTPLFVGKPAISLQPLDTRTWADSGNVLVRYDVRRKES